eukprot:TRINITY_DN2431_c0_g1_i4.p3 TRINITY_DN2431_c0_g1~~TRINITY_DN2431_c0_g1_i4.p3  ORF type:complete len:109 (-),score=25.05 TRINITY_DN2431_c0_g1_i4:108-434(-)
MSYCMQQQQDLNQTKMQNEQNSDNEEPMSTKQQEKLYALWKTMIESKKSAQFNLQPNQEFSKQNESTFKSAQMNDFTEKTFQRKQIIILRQKIKQNQRKQFITNKQNQ